MLNEVKKKAGNPAALGKCRLNEENELVFETETGRLDASKLKQYLATFPGMQRVSNAPAAQTNMAKAAAAGESPKAVRTESPGGADQKAAIAAFQSVRNQAIAPLSN